MRKPRRGSALVHTGRTGILYKPMVRKRRLSMKRAQKAKKK